MKKILKKFMIGAGILIPTVSIPISTSCILKNKNNLNVENQNINPNLLTKANESYQYYNYDTAIVDQQIENITIKTNPDVNDQTIPKNQELTFTYNFAFRDYVPDNGYADVFLQLTKLDFLFDDIKIYKPLTYRPNGNMDKRETYQIPFQFNFNYKQNELNSQFGFSDSSDNGIKFKSFQNNELNYDDMGYDFPFGDYQGKQYIFNLYTDKVYNEKFPVNPYPSTNPNGVGVTFQDLINSNPNATNLTVIRDPDNTTNTIQFNFKFVTQDGYLFTSPSKTPIKISPRQFKLKITSNYFINSTSNVVYDKLVVSSNRLQIWNPDSTSEYNIIKLLLDNQESNTYTNIRKLYFDTIKPVVNLNNIYLNNQVNKTYNVDVYLTDVVFGNQNGSNITTANHFPLYINLNINPSVDKTIHVNKNIDIFGGITLNVQFDLKQDEDDPLKYYLYDIGKPNVQIKNNGYIQLTLNKSNIYDGSNVANNFVVVIADNFDSLTIFNPDFDIREIVHYIKSSINHDIILNVEQKSIRKINPENAVHINSDSHILDIFDNSYIDGSISNKQLILNEINTRIDNFLSLPSVQKWINGDINANPRDSFYNINPIFSYKKLSTDASIESNYYSQGTISVKLEPKQANNYIFPSFEFNINVYMNKSENWNNLLTVKLNDENIKKLFSSYYSWKLLRNDLDSSLTKRKLLLSNLVTINDNRISNYQFNSIIADINLECLNEQYYLNISLNNNQYCFYDPLAQAYTNHTQICLGKQNFKPADKTYIIDIECDGQKLYDTIHDNYENLDQFLAQYSSLESKLAFFKIKTNSDRIENIEFNKTDVENELEIKIITKTGFENYLYCESEIINPDFDYNQGESSYSLVISNLLFKNQISNINKIAFSFDIKSLWDNIHNFDSYSSFLNEFGINPHIIDSSFTISEVNESDNNSIESKGSYNQYIKSISFDTTSTNQRIKVKITLNPGYAFDDQAQYNISKTFYIGNVLTLLEDPYYTPNQILKGVDIYLDKQKITDMKLDSKNIDNFVNEFNADPSQYLDLFLNNNDNEIDINTVLQPQFISADWYKNSDGKLILRFILCLKNGYYFTKSNLTKSLDDYHQFYNQYEIDVDNLVADDQLVIGGHKIDKSLFYGLIGGGIGLIIVVVIVTWTLYVYIHNKKRLERSRKED